MAEVLTVSSFEHNPSSSLHRNNSQTSLHTSHHTSNVSTLSQSDFKSAYRLRDPHDSLSQPSSAPSSPALERVDFSNTTSFLSTPSSSLSLDDNDCDSDDDQYNFHFPSYASSTGVVAAVDDDLDPDETLPELSSRKSKAGSSTDSSEVETPSRVISRTNSVTLATIADDTAVKPQPTRHVDYLSHNWQEEDIWSSWRHIVTKRGELENWERLENASWRTWMKAQRQLNTVNPDKLNWMKDHDVTWLYGPLQTGSSHIKKEDTSGRGSFSRSNSFLAKKPILKRRSVSEIMLARSLSTQSLMRQATDAIRAQEAAAHATRSGMNGRLYSDISSRPSPVNSSNRTGPETPSPFTSSTSSGSETPDERRHIHFNETVEQCVAITPDHDDREYEDSALEDDDSHSSDEEFLTMKTDRTIDRKLSRNSTPRGSFSEQGGKTIAMLPATKLKYRSDTPDADQRKASARVPGAGGLRGSSSQETLRPTHPSSNFLLDDEDDDEPMDPSWKSRPTSKRTGNGNSPHPSQLGLDLYRDDNDELQRAGMRRTPSGMFMPYDEAGEVGADGATLIGKVYDTYNTARDIAHVIWNVGWRR